MAIVVGNNREDWWGGGVIGNGAGVINWGPSWGMNADEYIEALQGPELKIVSRSGGKI